MNIIYGKLYGKNDLWHPRRHEGGISNTVCTSLFIFGGRCNHTFPNWRRKFSSFFGTYIVSVLASTPRHTVGSIIIMHYINRTWYWWLQEYGKCDEVHTMKNWTTTDPVNRQVWKKKVVHWCRIWGTQGHEESHWWFHDHGNRRGPCLI